MDHYEKARRKLLLHGREADRLRERLIATLLAVGAPEERIERIRHSGEYARKLLQAPEGWN
ncbi:MAG TPA: hypothetical protein VGV85_02490 [Longimicrobiaceae bacterium]|nr:hypothetical protein [Longimicrobiaceae bacterium]